MEYVYAFIFGGIIAYLSYRRGWRHGFVEGGLYALKVYTVEPKTGIIRLKPYLRNEVS